MPSAPAGAPRVPSLDSVLTIIVWALVAAVVGLGGWFGYTVWVNTNQSRLATPALRSIEGLKAMARRSPNDITIRIRLGEALGQAGMYDEAVQQLTQALNIDRKHTGALLDLGLIAAQRNEWNTAESYFQRVADLTDGIEYANVNDQRETALYYLGECALRSRRYEDAISWFKAALRIRRDAADTYLEMASAYKGMGDLDAALKQLEIGVTFDPTYAQAFYEMGQIYSSKKDVVNAASCYAKSAELAPDAEQPKEALASLGTADEWKARAVASLKENKVADAVDEVLVARMLAPKDVSLAKLHAQIAEKKGDKKSALAIWKEAEQLAPSDQDIKAAIKRLSSER